MKWSYKILRSLAVSLIVLIFVVPAVVYVAVSLPGVQNVIRKRAERELSQLLTVPVSIDKVIISPFNRVMLRDVAICGSDGETALSVYRLGAGMSLWDYFYRGQIVLDYAEIIGLDARITRDSIGSPLNIQPIIDALSPKDKSKPPTRFDLRVNTVVIRRSVVSYDIRNQPLKENGFDRNHISVSDLNADLRLPQLKNDDFIIDLRRMAFEERSGLKVNSLSGKVHVSDKLVALSDLDLQMPHSRLLLNDQSVVIDGLSNLANQLRTKQFDIELLKGSHISSRDLTPLLPQLAELEIDFNTELHLLGSLQQLEIQKLLLSSTTGARISAYGTLANLDSLQALSVELPQLQVRLNSPRALTAALRFAELTPTAKEIINNLGDIDLDARISGDMLSGDITARLTSAPGAIDVNTSYHRQSVDKSAPIKLTGTVDVADFSGARLMGSLANPLSELTDLNALANLDITLRGGIEQGDARLNISSLAFKGLEISNITTEIHKTGNDYSGRLFVDDNHIFADATLNAFITPAHKSLDLDADFRDVSLSLLGLARPGEHDQMTAEVKASLSGSSLDDIVGNINLDHLLVERPGHKDFLLGPVTIESRRSADADSIALRSEIADADIRGHYHLKSIVPVGKAILARTLPALAMASEVKTDDTFWNADGHCNEFTCNIRVKTLQPLEALKKMPVAILDPVVISGDFSTARRSMSMRVDAPYLAKGNKLIENTAMIAGVSGSDSLPNTGAGHLYITSTIPTKNGQMTVIATSSARNDCVDSRIEWKIDRDRDFSGDLSLSAAFSRSEEGGLKTLVNVNPSRLVFNDTVWTVDPSRIAVEGKDIDVERFRIWRDRQYIAIGGRASELDTDTITVDLQDVNLDYIFETLDLASVTFGGNATGKIYGSRLLTKDPVATIPDLRVKRLTFNNSLMGDAVIRSGWKNATGAIPIDAIIHQPNGLESKITGGIYPLADSLDLHFDCDRVSLGFLKRYMHTFATDVTGHASGRIRIFGTFKLVDLTGDVYGEDVSLTIGFTNVEYTTTDSVHFRPGRIILDDLTLRDRYGHTGKFSGWVSHQYFKESSFDFQLTDARELLVYDMKENNDFQWYGRMFGNGGAHIEGVPGFVSISVDMTTADNSTFNYVLSNAMSAQDYNFITFRDRDRAHKDSIAALNAPPDPVREFRERIARQNLADEKSNYSMTFNIGITPQATITMIMDPVGGDRIRCHGSGVLGLSYDSVNEDLRMNGTYTLEDGKYNFTLQDIIIKDFTIEPGSAISFNGDPNAAQLNLTAKFQVKANLTDLDESFADDKELNRTNVPVDALLKVTGDMRQPEISFDLAFPTLTEETRRKVQSIINTEDMMNRQIIYLLALNRFYTPDYMNATRGNELFSVASSTIASQLSNILGQLSDNWSLAPNLRSDRGDFSDVEFDMAISSNLLNNRLLLNGNLGYRDKSLNNNSFIGDFDIEYLLNRQGSLRLKAYNRYNDQNYYLKSALTTQGVGIVYKRDFDDILSFLRRRPSTPLPADSTSAAPSDTIQQQNE